MFAKIGFLKIRYIFHNNSRNKSARGEVQQPRPLLGDASKSADGTDQADGLN